MTEAEQGQGAVPAGQPTDIAQPTATGTASPRLGRRGLIALIAAGSVCVLMFVAAGVGIGVAAAQFSPQVQVERYLDAVRDGHIEDALAITRTNVEKSDVLLSDAVYAKATDRVSGYRITGTSTVGDTAKVTARVTVGTESFRQDFTLKRSPKRQALFFDAWALIAPELGTVRIDQQTPFGVDVLMPGVTPNDLQRAMVESPDLRAFPGTYAVSVDENEWIEAAPAQATVAGFGARSEAKLIGTLTDAGTAVAEKAVNDYIDACVASTELVPEGCGFGLLADGYVATDIAWKLDVRPTFGFDSRYGGLMVDTTTPGSLSMTCTATRVDGATGQCFNEHPVAFTVDGMIGSFRSGAPSFTPTAPSLLPKDPGAPS